jgi:hypothetical protein
VFLHSDDTLLPKKLECQADLLAHAGPSVGAAESAIDVEWPERVERWTPHLDAATPFDLLAYRRRVHISGLMIRRNVAAQLRFDERLRGAEDRDFCIRLLRTTNVVCNQEPLSRVSKIGPRLSHQNMGPIYVYLLEKFQDDIATDRRVHADWHYRIARAFARAGQLREARSAIREAVRLSPGNARRWPLWLASFGGEGLTRNAFRAQVRTAELAPRLRRR